MTNSKNIDKNTKTYARRGADNVGDVTEAIVSPVGNLVEGVLSVAGRSIGEAIGGLGGGLADGGKYIGELVRGPEDPEEYEAWMAKKEEREQMREERRTARMIRKQTAPLQAAMASMKAMADFTQAMGQGMQQQAQQPIDYDKLAEAIAKKANKK